jgi:DNA-binding PadR family transcriptional regulator
MGAPAVRRKSPRERGGLTPCREGFLSPPPALHRSAHALDKLLWHVLILIACTSEVVFRTELCQDYYVPRSTKRDVVAPAADLGHFSDPPLLVLASLADGSKHGHAMIEDIVEMSGTRLGPGTLYGAITRLEREALIEPLPPDERRYPYRITAKGMKVLRARLATLQRFVRAGLRRLEAR